MTSNFLKSVKIRLHYLIAFKRIPWQCIPAEYKDVYKINGERWGYGGDYGEFEYVEDLITSNHPGIIDFSTQRSSQQTLNSLKR